MRIGDTWKTHQGGTVVITRTGLIHKAGNAYSGTQIAVPEVETKPKRGRGRPRKNP